MTTSTTPKSCLICEEPALLRCAACQRATYCSKTCQAAHWKLGHKQQCRVLRQAREKGASMSEKDAKEALRELEDEVRKMDMKAAYREMRHAQAELARYQAGTKATTKALDATVRETPEGAKERASTVSQLMGVVPISPVEEGEEGKREGVDGGGRREHHDGGGHQHHHHRHHPEQQHQHHHHHQQQQQQQQQHQQYQGPCEEEEGEMRRVEALKQVNDLGPPPSLPPFPPPSLPSILPCPLDAEVRRQRQRQRQQQQQQRQQQQQQQQLLQDGDKEEGLEEEEVEGEEEMDRDYCTPRVIVELQPMIQKWSILAWPPSFPCSSSPSPSPSSSIAITHASASLLFFSDPPPERDEGVQKDEQGQKQQGQQQQQHHVQLHLRFAILEGGGEGGKEGGRVRWYRAKIPFPSSPPPSSSPSSTGRRSSRASCRQRRLPITIATDHLSIKLPLSSSSSSSSSSMPGAAAADCVGSLIDSIPTSLAAGLEKLVATHGPLHLACRYCHALVLRRPLPRFLALPSEILDDVSDYMLCFRDSVLPLSSDQLHALPSLGLCGEGFFLLPKAALRESGKEGGRREAATEMEEEGEEGKEEGEEGKEGRVVCGKCEAAMGMAVRTEEGRRHGDVHLWMHSLGLAVPSSTVSSPPPSLSPSYTYLPYLEEHVSVDTHIASVLRRASQRLKKRRFVLRCEEEEEEEEREGEEGGGEGEEGGGMEVVVWGSEVLLLEPMDKKHTQEEEGGEDGRERRAATPGTPALKVSFRFLPFSLSPSPSFSSSPPSSALELTLPVEEWHALAALLEASAASDFPSSMHVPFAPARLAYLPLCGRGS